MEYLLQYIIAAPTWGSGCMLPSVLLSTAWTVHLNVIPPVSFSCPPACTLLTFASSKDRKWILSWDLMSLNWTFHMHLNHIYTFLNGISCCSLLHVDESHMIKKVVRSSSLRESESVSRPSVRPPACADPPVSSFHNPIKKDSAVKISCGGKKKCKGMARVIKIYWIDHELKAVFFHPRSTGCDGCFVGRGSSCDATQETGFNGRTKRFVPDAIIGKELTIIIQFTEMSHCQLHLMLRVILCAKSPANDALTKHFNQNVKPWGNRHFGWGWTVQWNKVGRFFFVPRMLNDEIFTCRCNSCQKDKNQH